MRFAPSSSAGKCLATRGHANIFRTHLKMQTYKADCLIRSGYQINVRLCLLTQWRKYWSMECTEKQRLLLLLGRALDAYGSATTRMINLFGVGDQIHLQSARLDADNARITCDDLKRSLQQHCDQHGC